MNDHQLTRYSRHLLLEEFGFEAQNCLLTAHVLVIGAGGLGSAALPYLASAGVGRISIADGDVVDLTNLQRQIMHTEARIGMNKAQSAKEALQAINSTIKVDALPERLSDDALTSHISAADLVLDCSDNFATRYAVNHACYQAGRPLVSGAAIRFEGQVLSFDFRQAGCPCYACLFPMEVGSEEERCAVMGVFAPLVGVIGSMQAAEAIRLLTGVGNSLQGRLLRLDGRSLTWHEYRYAVDPACQVCGVSSTHARAMQQAPINSSQESQHVYATCS